MQEGRQVRTDYKGMKRCASGAIATHQEESPQQGLRMTTGLKLEDQDPGLESSTMFVRAYLSHNPPPRSHALTGAVAMLFHVYVCTMTAAWKMTIYLGALSLKMEKLRFRWEYQQTYCTKNESITLEVCGVVNLFTSQICSYSNTVIPGREEPCQWHL